MFTGLSAFPLTPLRGDRLDLAAFRRVVAMLGGSGVDTITALGWRLRVSVRPRSGASTATGRGPT